MSVKTLTYQFIEFSTLKSRVLNNLSAYFQRKSYRTLAAGCNMLMLKMETEPGKRTFLQLIHEELADPFYQARGRLKNHYSRIGLTAIRPLISRAMEIGLDESRATFFRACWQGQINQTGKRIYSAQTIEYPAIRELTELMQSASFIIQLSETPMSFKGHP